MVKKTYQVSGMHCTSCALVIESDLADSGVKASCNYANTTLVVEYDEASISEATISDIVRSSGYELASP